MAIFECSNIRMVWGSKGDKVKTLQTHLKTLGYYSGKLDGDFARLTYNAVRAFQNAHGLSVDGIFGTESCKKLNAVMDSRQQTAQNNTSTKVFPFDCPNTSLQVGSSGEKVKQLQQILKDLKYYNRQVDGDFGDKTRDAVITLQKKQGNDPDGWFGKKTCEKLKITFKNLYPNSVTSTSTSSSASSSAKKDVLVKLSELPRVPPYCKLVVHPEVVVLPESELEMTQGGTKNKVTGGSIDATTNFNCETINLQVGSKGEDVKKLQTILKARGYYTRQIDGDFGDKTKKAVMKLQSAQGNDPDGWFGKKTCSKLQGTSSTSSNATGTSNKKNTDYTIDDWTTNPSFTDDMEGLSHDVTLKTTFTPEKLAHVRKLQKTTFTMLQENNELYKHQGYINEIKISQETGDVFLEITITGYTVFLNQTYELTSDKTGKRSDLLKELIKTAGLKADVDLTGLDDSDYTLKAQATTTATSGGSDFQSGLSGNDCTETNVLSARSFDIDACKGGTKIGNSSANYAVDTANMSAKEALLDVYNRFHYGPSLSSSRAYSNNRRCPQQMWSKTGKFWGNCADVARLVKCVGEVHGLKVGIRHAPNHYYNLIEINGKVYRFDCCFQSSGYTGRDYGNELCNNLNKNGGPWQ